MAREYEIRFVAEIQAAIAQLQEGIRTISQMHGNIAIDVNGMPWNDWRAEFEALFTGKGGGKGVGGQGGGVIQNSDSTPTAQAAAAAFTQASKSSIPHVEQSAMQAMRSDSPNYKFLKAQQDDNERQKQIDIITKGKGTQAFIDEKMAGLGGSRDDQGSRLALSGLKEEAKDLADAMRTLKIMERRAIEEGNVSMLSHARKEIASGREAEQDIAGRVAGVGEQPETGIGAKLASILMPASIAAMGAAYNQIKDHLITPYFQTQQVVLGQQAAMMSVINAQAGGGATFSAQALGTVLDPMAQRRAAEIGNNAWWANEDNVGLFAMINQTVAGGSPLGAQSQRAQMKAYEAMSEENQAKFKYEEIAMERSKAIIPYQRAYGKSYADTRSMGLTNGWQYGISEPELASGMTAFERISGSAWMNGNTATEVSRLMANGIDPASAADLAMGLYRKGNVGGGLDEATQLLNQAYMAGASTNIATQYASQVTGYGTSQGRLGAPGDTSIMQSAVAHFGMDAGGLAAASGVVGEMTKQSSSRGGIYGLGKMKVAQDIVDRYAPGLDNKQRTALISALAKRPESQWNVVFKSFGIDAATATSAIKAGVQGNFQFRRDLMAGISNNAEQQELVAGPDNAQLAVDLAGAGAAGVGSDGIHPGGRHSGVEERAKIITDDTSVAFQQLRAREDIIQKTADGVFAALTQAFRHFSKYGVEPLLDQMAKTGISSKGRPAAPENYTMTYSNKGGNSNKGGK